MPALLEKDSRAQSSRGGGGIPDFPKFHPALADVPGAQETNASIQRWNDLMKRRWVLLDEDLTKRFQLDAGFNDGLVSLQAQLLVEQTVRANADFALASSITALEASFTSATLALQAEIDLEETTRASADSALATSISTVSASVGSLTATVTTLSSSLATANSYLESRWTVQVSAGPIVTGMTLFSSTGADTDVSYIAFQADRFQINTASGGNKQIFSATASAVKLGDVLTVDLAGQKVFIGGGTFNNSGTPFYVDSAGNLSLGNRLSWNGTTLSITGSVTATSGEIGGWTISTTTLSKNNAILDSAGQLVLGTSNDVVYLSATDGTYRLWVGNVSAGSASFSVTKAGLLFANNAQIAGTFVASDNASYPTWQGGTLATRGVFNQRSGGVAPAYASLAFGTSNLIEGNVALGSYGALSAVTTTGIGILFNSKYYNGGSWVSGSGIEIRNDASVAGASAASSYIQMSTTNTSTVTSIWRWRSDGKLDVGDVFGQDTNLYRSAANTWKTDDAFLVGGLLTAEAHLLMNPSQRLYFHSTSNGTYINENNGIEINGDGSHPIKIVGGNLQVQQSLSVTGTLTAGTFSPSSVSASGNVSAGGYLQCGGGTSNNVRASSGRLYLMAGGSNRWYISDSSGNFVLPSGQSGRFVKETSDGYTITLSDGTNDIRFQYSGGHLYVSANGGGNQQCT